MPYFFEILQEVQSQLPGKKNEAEWMLVTAYRQVMGQSLSRINFYTSMREEYPVEATELVRGWVGRIQKGELLQHVLGFQVFLDHEYHVSPNVLIPRPETEILVQAAVQEILHTGVEPRLGFEIGIGSGVLSIELLKRFVHLKMVATEVSDTAIQQALNNANRILGEDQTNERLKIVRVSYSKAVWEGFKDFENHKGKVDFLISNPPYLVPGDPIEEDVLRNEPKMALMSPDEADPLYFYRRIAEEARDWLKPGHGKVFVEIPCFRSEEIGEIFQKKGWTARVVQDLNQLDRVIISLV